MKHLRESDIPHDEGLDNPEWLPNFDPDGVTSDTHDSGSDHPAVRTLSGAIDFLHGVEHDLSKWWENEVEQGRDPHNQLPEWLADKLPYRPNKVKVTADVEASEDIDLSAYTLGTIQGQAYQQVLRPREDRFRAVVTNWGPGIVYLSAETGIVPSATNSLNAVQIAPNASRELRTRAGIYAYPTTGQTPTIDIQDEFGYRE